MVLSLELFAAAWLNPLLSGWAAMASVPSARETSSDEEDTVCMARLAAGETHALQPIFDRWKLPLLTYFYRALGSHADAEDLVLQTFARVHRAADRYRPEARFTTWLFAIARRELLHELRRQRRKPVEPVPPEDLDISLVSGQTADPQRVREAEEHLLSALQRLPERERSALLLASSGDHSHADLATTLGVSPGNLSVILHRAREKLRVLLS